MDNKIILYTIDKEELINEIVERVANNIKKHIQRNEEYKERENFLDEYVPKTEVRGVLASNSTLWKWENEGKLKAYALGGRRYYKRDDINNLFEEVDK